MVREQVFQKVPFDMKKHLMQTKILDTAKLAAKAEAYASLDPNYGQKHAKKNQTHRNHTGQNNIDKDPRDPSKPGANNNYRKRPYAHASGNNSSTTTVTTSDQIKSQNDNPRHQQHSHQNKWQSQSSKKFKPTCNQQRWQGQNRNRSNQSQGQSNAKTGTTYNVNRCAQGNPGHVKTKFMIPGKIQGKKLNIFRDSGCDKTAVK